MDKVDNKKVDIDLLNKLASVSPEEIAYIESFNLKYVGSFYYHPTSFIEDYQYVSFFEILGSAGDYLIKYGDTGTIKIKKGYHNPDYINLQSKYTIEQCFPRSKKAAYKFHWSNGRFSRVNDFRWVQSPHNYRTDTFEEILKTEYFKKRSTIKSANFKYNELIHPDPSIERFLGPYGQDKQRFGTNLQFLFNDSYDLPGCYDYILVLESNFNYEKTNDSNSYAVRSFYIKLDYETIESKIREHFCGQPMSSMYDNILFLGVKKNKIYIGLKADNLQAQHIERIYKPLKFKANYYIKKPEKFNWNKFHAEMKMRGM